MKVVCNAGPLITLGKLGRLGLLLKLYDQILIPQEVYNEVVVNGFRQGAAEARAVDWSSGKATFESSKLKFPLCTPIGDNKLILANSRSSSSRNSKRPIGRSSTMRTLVGQVVVQACL